MRALLIAVLATSVSACSGDIDNRTIGRAQQLCATFGGLREVDKSPAGYTVYATCNDGTHVNHRYYREDSSPQSFVPLQSGRVRKFT